MKRLKSIYTAVGRFVGHPWFVFSVVAALVVLFSVWYGAAWTLIISLPLLYDHYITRRIRSWHKRMMDRHRWWRVIYAVWCALLFAVVVGVIVEMVLFRWDTPFLITFVVVMAFALWNELRGETKIYKWLYGWVHAIIFATVVATLIQLYLFQMFVIPTGSMESTLMAGDYILVNKVAYGPRVPMTPLSFPFVHNTMPMNDQKASFSTAWERSYRRLAGTAQVERGDVVVFNFPEGDTVVMEMAAMSYYDLLRNPDYSRELGATEAERCKTLAEQFTVVVRPLDKKENYIKRCVGLPGDVLSVRDGVVYHGEEAEAEVSEKQYYYNVENRRTGKRTERLLRDSELAQYGDTAIYTLSKVDGYTGTQLIPHLSDGDTASWTINNFGPVWVPKAGQSIELTDENMALYGRCIAVYEQRLVERKGGKIYIDGVEATHYTFLMDYYFMMGDNRHESLDSRFWGFVPEDHIVGKASYVWFSRDINTGEIRWERMFNSIE